MCDLNRGPIKLESQTHKTISGMRDEVFEQPEQPGLATMDKANYDRIMKVMTQAGLLIIRQKLKYVQIKTNK